MAVLFVVNPVAGKGRALKLLPMIERTCKGLGTEYMIEYTREHGDGRRIAEEAVENGFERIISVGGDGTLNEVVNGIANKNAVLGVIPGGTGNDFIKTICFGKNIQEIIEIAIAGKISNIDLAKCDDNYFLNIGSGGLDAEVALESEKTRKYFPGSMAYLIAMLKMILLFKGSKMHVQIDEKEFDLDTLMVVVANGRYYGGGFLPTPEADLTDGIFDVCFIEKMPKLKMLAVFPRFKKGKHAGIKGVHFFKGSQVKLSSNTSICVNIDGEVAVKEAVEFTIIPAAIRVAVAQ